MILDGKKVANELKENLFKRIDSLKKNKIFPSLSIVLVGNNPASQMYSSFLTKTVKKYGLDVRVHEYSENILENELVLEIKKLNEDENVDGILIMMPLPKHISEEKIIDTILPEKDIDGLTTVNIGSIVKNKDCLCPCTPKAVMTIFESYKIDIEGKDVVVLGRSAVVGKTLALMLLNKNATVTVCHSKTRNLKDKTLNADILISAIGKPHYVKEDMVKKDAIVIDVGINKLNGKTVGDVDYEKVEKTARAITPVPGGVGSVTTTVVVDTLVSVVENKFLHKKG